MVHDAIAYAPYVSFRFLNLMALGPGVKENTAEFLLQHLTDSLSNKDSLSPRRGGEYLPPSASQFIDCHLLFLNILVNDWSVFRILAKIVSGLAGGTG